MPDEIPPFLEVPGVPGGRVATAGLSPDSPLLAQYGGVPHFPNTPGGVDRPVALMDPPLTDQQKASLASRSTYNAPPQSPRDVLATANAIELAKAGGFDPAAPPPAEAAPQVPPASSPSVPPGGPSGGPMGMATATLKGSFPGAVPSYGYGGGAWDQAAKAQKQANQVAIDAAEVQAAGEAKRAELLQQEAQAAQAKEEQRQQLAGESRKHIEAAQKEMQAPDGKVDANRLWANKSTGQKVLAGMAVFLTGLGQGLMGKGGNPALEMIQKQIDDDINLQREAIAAERSRKKDNFSATVQRHNLLREQLGDERAVESAERGMRWAAAEQMLKSKLSLLQGDEAKARGAQMLASIGLEKEKYFREASFRSAQLGMQRLELAAKLSAAKGGDKETAQHLAEVEDRYRNIKTTGQKVQQMLKNKGTWEATGSHNKELDRLVTDMAIDMAKLKDPRSVARSEEVEAEKKNLMQAGFFTRNSTAENMLENFLGSVDERRRLAYDVRGFRPPSAGGLGPQVMETRQTPDGRTVEKLSDGTFRLAGQGAIANGR